MNERKTARPSEAMKPVTIYDVADRAKVSIKTVSKVINDRPDVNRATRSRVLAAVKALSYKPNQQAQSLALQKSHVLALFCDTPAAGSGYITQIQLAILTICQNNGYHLVVECIQASNPNAGQRVLALLAQIKLAGVILAPPLSDREDLIEILNAANTPVVRFSPARPIADSFDVDIDNLRAAYDVTKYLIDLGHKRIGFVRGPLRFADTHLRFEGYKRALIEAGIPYEESLCPLGDYTYKSGVLAGDLLLSQKEQPTAIFASNDDMAAGVMAASIRYKLRIPQDLSIAGFDDAVIAHAMSPRLTTCRQPIADMAETAVTALIRPSGVSEHTLRLPHKLVIRNSTAAPRTSG